MIPHLVIGVAALVGLFGWGLKGLILGAIGGLVFNLLFGSVLSLFLGGLLPPKVRKEAASRFIVFHPDLAKSVFPNTSQPALQKSVERCIESIFKRAVADNKSMNLAAAWDRTAIQAATAVLITEEPRPEMKTFLAALEQHIEREMYPCGRIWQQFEGRSNDKLALREKAQVLAPVLLQTASQHGESLVKGTLSLIGKDRQGQIFFECLIIDLFMLDRLAFAVLGVEKRPWFMVPLLQEVFGRLGAPSDDDKDAEEMREAFGQLYHDRVHQYALCQFAARPNERGGYDIDNTVGWKLGENLGVDDMTKMLIELDIASHYITVAKNLQLRELIAGY